MPTAISVFAFEGNWGGSHLIVSKLKRNCMKPKMNNVYGKAIRGRVFRDGLVAVEPVSVVGGVMLLTPPPRSSGRSVLAITFGISEYSLGGGG